MAESKLSDDSILANLQQPRNSCTEYAAQRTMNLGMQTELEVLPWVFMEDLIAGELDFQRFFDAG